MARWLGSPVLLLCLFAVPLSAAPLEGHHETQLRDLFPSLVDMLSQLRLEEFVNWLACILPIGYALPVALRLLTGRGEGASDAPEQKQSETHTAIVNFVRKNQDHSDAQFNKLAAKLQSLEARMEDMETGNKGRMSDFHQDLAFTYFQLSKLRQALTPGAVPAETRML